MKIYLLALLMAGALISCRKEHSRVQEDALTSEVQLTFGNTSLVMDNPGQPNARSFYQFGGNAGNYFGLVADFRCSSSATLQLLFGNIITSDYFLTEENMRQLLSTGEKPWASLGSFNAFPATVQGAVEIAFTDPDGVRWCSTKQVEKEHNGAVHTQVTLPDSGTLTIDTAFLNESTYGLNPSFLVKGKINTTLYEVNGHRGMPLAGKFCALVGMEN